MRVRKFFPAIPFLFCLFFLAAQTAAESNQFDVKSEAVTVRPWLGVTVQDINEETAKSIGLENDNGVLVSGVVTGGPAGEAGLNPGDVILRLNGSEVAGAEEFASKIQKYPVGSIVSLDVNREGEVEIVRIALDSMPDYSSDSYDYEMPAFCPEGKNGCMDEKGQCSWKDSCPMRGKKEREKYDKMYSMASQELGLSPDQAKKAKALESDYMKKSIKARADKELAQVELKELTSAEPVLLDKVRVKLNDVASKKAELKFIRIKAREDFKKILTDEQRQKLDEIMALGLDSGMDMNCRMK